MVSKSNCSSNAVDVIIIAPMQYTEMFFSAVKIEKLVTL